MVAKVAFFYKKKSSIKIIHLKILVSKTVNKEVGDLKYKKNRAMMKLFLLKIE